MTDRVSAQVDVDTKQASKNIGDLGKTAKDASVSFAHMPLDVQRSYREIQKLVREHQKLGFLDKGKKQIYQENLRGLDDYYRKQRQILESHQRGTRGIRMHERRLEGMQRYVPGAGGYDAMAGEAPEGWGVKQPRGGGGGGGKGDGWGDYLQDAARGAFGKFRQTARMGLQLMGLYSGVKLVTQSLNDYEDRVKSVNRLGSQMGGSFGAAGAVIDRVRSKYYYLREETVRATEAYTKYTGKTAGMMGIARYARRTGLDFGQSAAAFGAMMPYIGDVNEVVRKSGRAGPAGGGGFERLAGEVVTGGGTVGKPKETPAAGILEANPTSPANYLPRSVAVRGGGAGIHPEFGLTGNAGTGALDLSRDKERFARVGAGFVGAYGAAKALAGNAWDLTVKGGALGIDAYKDWSMPWQKGEPWATEGMDFKSKHGAMAVGRSMAAKSYAQYGPKIQNIDALQAPATPGKGGAKLYNQKEVDNLLANMAYHGAEAAGMGTRQELFREAMSGAIQAVGAGQLGMGLGGVQTVTGTLAWLGTLSPALQGERGGQLLGKIQSGVSSLGGGGVMDALKLRAAKKAGAKSYFQSMETIEQGIANPEYVKGLYEEGAALNTGKGGIGQEGQMMFLMKAIPGLKAAEARKLVEAGGMMPKKEYLDQLASQAQVPEPKESKDARMLHETAAGHERFSEGLGGELAPKVWETKNAMSAFANGLLDGRSVMDSFKSGMQQMSASTQGFITALAAVSRDSLIGGLITAGVGVAAMVVGGSKDTPPVLMSTEPKHESPMVSGGGQ